MTNMLQFMAPSSLITKDSPIFRLPSFPPPDDWPVSVDYEGKPLSYYGDDKWDYTALGYAGFNFGKQGFSKDNLHLVKLAMITVVYHPGLFTGSIKGCVIYFQLFTKIAKACDKQKIKITDLYKFPRTHQAIISNLKDSKYQSYLTYLHKLKLYYKDPNDPVDFLIADDDFLSKMAAQNYKHNPIQTPYISTENLGVPE